MISINFPGKLTLGMKIIYGIVAVGIIGTIIAVIAFNRSSYLATTMRLVRTQGDVKIIEAGGRSKPATKNKRFESGDSLMTGVNDSLASVSLDDSKIVTLQKDSRADFIKKSKQIELKLTKGALFFEVIQKLNADETFEIKTSTLTAGIRGTSGYIYCDEEGRDSITVTDGMVIITAVNPDTGERKYAEVKGGQRLTVILYSDRTTDTVDFEIEDLKEENLNDFILKMLVENDKLLDKVCNETGWDKQKLKDLMSAILNTQIEGTEITPTPTEEETEPADTSESETETETETEETKNTSESSEATSGSTKPKATNTPKPKANNTNNNNHNNNTKPKATSTPKPKSTATPTPASGDNPGGSTGGDPTSGGGSSTGGDPTSGGGSSGGGEPTSGGGSSSGGDPTTGGGSTSGGGNPTTGGGSTSGGGNPTTGGGDSGSGSDTNGDGNN
jgi:hypothetical protein